jgi:uncharacterized protein YciI
VFIILLSYIRPLQEIDRLLADHRSFLERHYASGHFLLSGRKEPRTGGVILAKAKNRDEVEAIIRSDPFYVAQTAEYEIVEFTPTMNAAHLTGLQNS